ncbi:MAG: ATP-binding cassette domain-containing protein [Actinomycetota bacterium]
MTIFGFEVPGAVLVLGAITGMAYGLLAVGLVLVYRANRIVNFAHGEAGAFGAAIMALAVFRWRLPWLAAFPLGLASGAGAALVVELAVVRRLRNAPRLVGMVATLGFAQFLPLLAFALTGSLPGAALPDPPFLPAFDVGALHVSPSATGVLLLAPLAAIGLALLLGRTSLGTAMRASAASPAAVRTLGIHPGRMSALTWMLAGGLSAFTAILVFAARDLGAIQQSLGLTLLLRALAAGLLARMSSLSGALAAGVGIGVLEQVLRWNLEGGGTVELTLGVVVLGAVVVRRMAGPAGVREGAAWAAVVPWPPLPADVRPTWLVRHRSILIGAGAFSMALTAGLLTSAETATILSGVAALAIIALSVGLLSGLAGQLSLGQFALAGVGATVSALIARRTGNYVLAFAAAGCAAAVVSMMLGAAASRLRGLALPVLTLAFAAVVHVWLLEQPWMLGEGLAPGRPVIAGYPLDTGRRYFVFALVVLAAAVWVCARVRHGSMGRAFVALRDNEDEARAFGVRATHRALQASALAGALAGVGGAVLGHGLSLLTPGAFQPVGGIEVVAMAVVGGLGTLAGPVVGALYIRGVPSLVDLDAAGLAATAFGWLVLLLYLPSGLAGLFSGARDRLFARLPRTPVPPARPAVLARASSPTASPLLVATGLAKNFGGVRAVDGVSLLVDAGEAVALIGPNGAGKSTLLDVLSGFVRPDTGTVLFGGDELSRHPPEERARRGMVRSFQHPLLFPTLTVLEAVAVAAGTRRIDDVLDLLALVGLDAHRQVPVRELSTGMRRLAELSCVLARRPRLLLLDEPSAGIAQAEREGLVQLLLDVRRETGAGLVVVEHDIPLVRRLADRIVVMAGGRILADGSPDDVTSDPAVVGVYFGVAT